MVTEAYPTQTPAPAAPATGGGGGLWSWISTVDHKRIGIMYLITTFFFFLVGGVFALVLRLQLSGPSKTLVSPEIYDQIMTMHGTTMIFLFVVPVMAGFGNYLVPLQIGARDMAFPRLNALSFWLLLFGGMVMYSSFLWGGGRRRRLDVLSAAQRAVARARAGPVDRRPAHPRHLVVRSGAINFICTIHNMRAPGMRLSRMPLFTWTIDMYAFMIVAAGPVLAGALTMLLLDRNYGTNFYNPDHTATCCSTSTCSGSTPTRSST